MNKIALIFSLIIFLGSCDLNQSAKKSNEMTENITIPVCKKQAKSLTTHGHERIDNYYWLNQREDQEVIDYLNTENEYTDQIMEPTKKLQEKLYKEMRGRIKEQDESVPYFLNGYHYLTKYNEGSEHPIFSRKKENLIANEELLLDCNQLADGYDFFDFGSFEVSPNNQLMGYSYDTLSRRMYDLRFMDLSTKKLYPETINNTTGSLAWANDNKTVFYTKQDPVTLRSCKIYKHVLGTDSKNDELVYEEKDETFDCGVYKSKSDKYIIISTSSTLTDEFLLIDANEPNDQPKAFHPRERGLEYRIYHYKDQFYVQTNLNAQNFCLMTCPESNTAKENWKTLIAPRENTLIEYIETFEDHLMICERTDGLLQLRIIDLKTNKEHYVPTNDETYVIQSAANFELKTNKLRYWYSSLTTPGTTYEYDMDSKEHTILKQKEVLGDFNAADYVSKRLWAPSRDGIKIPISIVYKKGVELNGENPLLQYAYGSYGYSMEPYFSANRLSLLDRGFVFAIAHIRGGEELGRQWYENGKLLKKKNTFYDFIDCSLFLIDNKYTNKNKLYASGGSAGGLLMGAVYNMRPDLYKGLIAAVPFVDVVTTMLDETIPLTTSEYDEWGNPNNKEYYDYMLSYSPYDNVAAKDYTNLLVTTGLHDSQVQYWEPAKWVAKLRELKTDNNLVLLHTNMKTGHGGASGRFEYLKEIALDYAFLFMLEGIKE